MLALAAAPPSAPSAPPPSRGRETVIVGPGKAEKVARCQGGQSISLLGNSPRRSVPRATRARPGGLNRPSRGAPVLQRGCRGARRRRTAPSSPSPPPARPARPAARSYRAPRQTLPAHTAASPQRDRQAPPGAGRHKGHTSPGGCRSPGPTWPPPPPLRPPPAPDTAGQGPSVSWWGGFQTHLWPHGQQPPPPQDGPR